MGLGFWMFVSKCMACLFYTCFIVNIQEGGKEGVLIFRQSRGRFMTKFFERIAAGE